MPALPPIGSRVTIANVRSRPALNGREARVLSHDAAKGRCGILIDGEMTQLSLASASLQALPTLSGETPEDKCMRVALGHLLPGDRVTTGTGAEGTLQSVDGRMATVHTETATESSLLRDCGMVLPTGRQPAPTRRERGLVALGKWPARCTVDASGQWAVQGGRRGHGGLERDGVHWILQVGISSPVPERAHAFEIALELEGMDQGWGNSGDSGVLLAIRRAGMTFSSEPVLRLVYDWQRQRSRAHKATVSLGATMQLKAGDRIEVLLQCPNYPGWSAHCEKVNLTLHVETIAAPPPKPEPEPLPSGWREEGAVAAFTRLWRELQDERFLEIDLSHLSLVALQQQCGRCDSNPA